MSSAFFLRRLLTFSEMVNWLPKISTSLSIWFTLFIRLSSWGCWSASFASRWSLCPYISEAVSVIIGVGIRIDGGVAGILIKLKFGDFFNISFGGVLIWAWMPVFFFWYFLMFGWLSQIRTEKERHNSDTTMPSKGQC